MTKKILLVFALISAMLCSEAQNRSQKRQVKRLMNEALTEFEEQDYYPAWITYKKVLELDPDNGRAAVNAVISVFNLNYPADSVYGLIPNLEKNQERGAKFFLARIRHQQRELDKAIELLNQYKADKKKIHSDDQINYVLNMCQNAKKFIAAPKQSIIKNIGPGINSAFPDYVPVIMPDESALFFTSKRANPVHTRKNGDNTYFEDVYVSYKENGQWRAAESVGFPINTETNDGCVAISPDGQRMIVYRTASDVVSGDLYLTHKGKNNRWGELQIMSSEINTPYIETSACFSNDTSEIYFSSDRPGGLGGKDLYRIRKLPNGNWSVPFNLGPNVNTPYDEDAPYMHPDGVTLYFSSKGHNTMGEYDVFSSVYDPLNHQFGIAENLGHPINDVRNDIFFILSVDGQRAYYSSVKTDTYGGIDIYEIDTRFGDNDLRIRHGYSYTGDVAGRVKITLVDKETNKVNGYYFSNPDDGRFILVVNPLRAYKAIVEADDFDEQTFDIQPMAFDLKDEKLKFRLKKKSAE